MLTKLRSWNIAIFAGLLATYACGTTGRDRENSGSFAWMADAANTADSPPPMPTAKSSSTTGANSTGDQKGRVLASSEELGQSARSPGGGAESSKLNYMPRIRRGGLPNPRQVFRRVLLPIPADLVESDHGPSVRLFVRGQWQSDELGEDVVRRRLRVLDVVEVDIDLDDDPELVVAIHIDDGGSEQLVRILAYKWLRERRFELIGDSMPRIEISNNQNWVTHLRQLENHRVIASGECDKLCHGCIGRPCQYAIARAENRLILLRTR